MGGRLAHSVVPFVPSPVVVPVGKTIWRCLSKPELAHSILRPLLDVLLVASPRVRKGILTALDLADTVVYVRTGQLARALFAIEWYHVGHKLRAISKVWLVADGDEEANEIVRLATKKLARQRSREETGITDVYHCIRPLDGPSWIEHLYGTDTDPW